MSKICIVDIDGVIANSDARFARATTDGRVNWKIAFDPSLVTLDTLIPDADNAIRFLERRGYRIIFLTSRPEQMRDATETWLAQHELGLYGLIMKPAYAQFVKTVTWKASMVVQIVSESDVEKVLFIDDEEPNRLAVQAVVKYPLVCLPDLISIEDEEITPQ